MQIKPKNAFTLIELLIVIVIMGVLYSLALNNLQKVSNSSKEKLSLKNLKKFLLSFEFEDDAKIVCFNDCRECKLLLDGNETKQDIKNFIDDSLEAYKYDFQNGITKVTFEPYFDKNDVEQRVCFSYDISKNGVGDQIFVSYQSKVYDFSDYFNGVKVYDDIDEIVNKKESLLNEVLK